MDRVAKYLMVIGACIGLSGCITVKKSGKTVALSPASCVLTPDAYSRVYVDMDFLVPENYFSKRSRLFITPQFMSGDTLVEEYFPMVVDASVYSQKMRRKKILHGYQDIYEEHVVHPNHISGGFDIHYQDTLNLPAGTQNGRLRAVVSTDGCGQCTSIDTFYFASVSNPVSLMQNNLKPAWASSDLEARPKVMEGKGEAKLQFIINRHDINLELGNNWAELHSMRSKLEPILKDTLATIQYINIYGVASADGSLPFNTTLSSNRARSAMKWLIEELGIEPSLNRKMKVGSRPEGWLPVLEAMVADGHPDSVAVKDILMNYATENDDVQEKHIRRLPCWNVIKDRYLQKDRKVEYTYAYELKSFTTEKELLAMYKVRPDAFSLEELLRVATLFDTSESKQEVYERVISIYPQSEVAATNLAAIYLQNGQLELATKLTENVQGNSLEWRLNRALVYAQNGYIQEAADTLQHIDLPEARYDRGILLARLCHFVEAYELLSPYADMNTAIVALALHRHAEAAEIMGKITDESPLAEYVRALVTARLGDAEACREHLHKACQDETLAKRAANEPDFYPFRGEATVQDWLQQKGGLR